MNQDPEEPTPGELINAIADFIGSIHLFDVLKRKLAARSYREFFNRVIGIGLILTVVGILSLFIAWLTGSEGDMSILGVDLRGISLVVVVVLILWLLSVFVREVNAGRGVEEIVTDHFPGLTEWEPTFTEMVLAHVAAVILYGGILYLLISEFRIGGESIISAIGSILILGLLVGIVMVITGYLFRTINDLFVLLRSRIGSEDTSTPEAGDAERAN
jgi:hypothetical protein